MLHRPEYQECPCLWVPGRTAALHPHHLHERTKLSRNSCFSFIILYLRHTPPVGTARYKFLYGSVADPDSVKSVDPDSDPDPGGQKRK
jgi:hypothetical protein